MWNNILAKIWAKPDLGEINFQCKWRDSEKQERYDRYCKNLKEGKSEPYAGLAPDDYGYVNCFSGHFENGGTFVPLCLHSVDTV